MKSDQTFDRPPPVVPHYECEEFICGWGAAFINITGIKPFQI